MGDECSIISEEVHIQIWMKNLDESSNVDESWMTIALFEIEK